MSRIYIATFSENAVEVAKENNVNIELNDICISENLDPGSFDRTLECMRGEITGAGAKGVIMHGPFTEIIPAGIDHRFVDMGIERLNEAYEACRVLNINRMVVHSGYEPLMYFKEWHLEKSVDFWKRYMEGKDDFTIYIENVFDDEPQMMKNLVDALDDPRIKLCLDVGHANAMSLTEYDVYSWIEILGDRIGHFHLHNNDGSGDQHRALMDGGLDMERIIECANRCCGSDVTFTIESHECRESTPWLKNILEKE